MRTLKLLLAFFIVLGTTPMALAHDDRDDRNTVRARLSGFNEVHFIVGPPPALRGAVSTGAQGTFRATIHDATQTIDYTLTFEGLEADVTQSHIHFGQPRTVGGIVVWLCQTAGTPAPAAVAATTPLCGGPRANTVTGTITAAKVLDVVGQGIVAGEFAELIRAIRAGATYANVHSTLFPPGEIRGPIDGDD